MKLKLKKPFDGDLRFSQRFGNPDKVYLNLNMKGHNGHDWALPVGTPIKASHDGVVSFAGTDSMGGIGVELRSTQKYDFPEGSFFIKTLYWHIRVGGLVVKEGDVIRTGEVLGYSGNTGLSTGPHLHFAVKLLNDDFTTINKNNGYLGATDQLRYMDYSPLKPISRPLKLNERSVEVVNLQKLFNYFGLFNAADYYPRFGRKTQDALAIFQTVVMGPENLPKGYLENEVANGRASCGPVTTKFIQSLF